MVISCVAYGCSNEQDGRKIPFHTFPFKRPEILKLWIKAVRRDNWTPSKTSRLCGQHFLPTDYINQPGLTVKRLKPDAVPSVFSFPKHLKQTVNAPRRKIIKVIPAANVQTESELMEVDLPSDSPSTSATQNEKKFLDRGTQTVPVKIESLQRKVKTLKQKVKRKNIKINNMKEVINSIKKSGHSNENLDIVLNKYFEGLPLELVLFQKQKDENVHPGQRRYSSLMKQFVQTLYFYSPKAYNFLRNYFVLPNGRTIRKWLSGINCEPGILSEVLEFLKTKVASEKYLKNCALIVDAMSIRKQIVWDHSIGKMMGNVNYGGIADVDLDIPASEALFFQIVSYSHNFKCPVAYFLINKTDSHLQTQLVISCLRSLFEIGITIRSITSDGAQANITTYNKLGANIVANELVPYFSHPCDKTIRVYCILDICHMLKLARNALAEKSLKSNTGTIKWDYIQALDSIQSAEKLKLANSLSSSHINYKNKIMNVRLAAQTLSSGVADAIEYLENSDVADFKNSRATVEFIRIIDRAFDILNSRNPFGKGFKAPIRSNNLKYFEDICVQLKQYLESLTMEGIPLLNSVRKTFALGFILTMESVLLLAKDLFSLSEDPLQYFLSYKCSQDHLEIFFSCIRSRGGWNNNPNTLQLKWALRQLLYRNSVTCSISANCSNFEEYCTPAFEFRSEERQQQNLSPEEKKEISLYVDYLEKMKLSDLQENILYYISGYIVRRLVKETTCQHCLDILLKKDSDNNDHMYSAPPETFKKFTSFISRGGLVFASNVVYKILHFAERQFRLMVEKNEILKSSLNLKKRLINTALNYFGEHINLFQPQHPVTQEFMSEESHEFQIIRKILDIFIKCRFHHHSSLMNLKLHGGAATVRQKMSKLILFKNC